MKKAIGICSLVMLACVAAVGFGPKAAKAASGVQTVKENTEFSVDLDGDGVLEKLKLTIKGAEEYYNYGIISVDNVDVYSTPKDAYGYQVILQVVTCGKNVFLDLYQYGDNDYCVMHTLISVDKNNKAKKVIDFKKKETAVTTSTLVAATDKTITLSCGIQPSQTGWLTYKNVYKVKDGAVIFTNRAHKVTSQIKAVKKLKFVTNKTLTFTKKINGKKAFTLKKGKKVKLLNITAVKTKVYGLYQYGSKKGYIRIDKYYNKSLFKDIYKYLVG